MVIFQTSCEGSALFSDVVPVPRAVEFKMATGCKFLSLAASCKFLSLAASYQVRSFDSLLKSRMKNAQMRQKIYKNLLTRLVQDERVVTTLTKCKDLSRVAERVCIYVNK